MNNEKVTRMTIGELMDEALRRAKDDPAYKWVEKDLPMEYIHIEDSVQDLKLTSCAFDVIAETTFGTNEGIYGQIGMVGFWKCGETKVKRWYPGTLKTLATSKDAFVAMSLLVNLVAYYAHQYLNENLNRF